MEREKDSEGKISGLRTCAEESLSGQPSDKEDISALSPEKKVQPLIHELQVHQIEPETQNEKLHRAQQDLEVSQDKYSELYDFAPVGYFTLDQSGVILEANLTASGLLSIARTFLVGRPLARFVSEEDRNALDIHFRQVIETQSKQTCEVQLTKKDGSQILVRLDSLVLESRDVAPEILRTAVTDITKGKHADEALYAAELRYRRLFESAKDGILILDLDTGKILDVNRYLIDMLGYSHEEFLEKYLWEVSPFRDTALNKEAFAELQQKGYIRYEDLPLETRDGRSIAVEFISNSYLVHGMTFIQCNISDITERKRTEEALRKNEALLKEAQRVAQIGHWELDLATGIFSWSEEVFHIFGLDPERGEVSLADHRDLIHPEYWELLHDSVSRASTQGTPYDIELRLVRPDGSIRWLNAKGSPIRNVEGAIFRLFGIAQDITDRKTAEEERLRSLGRQERLNRLQQALLAPGELVQKLKMITDGVVDVFGADFCRIWVISPGDLCECGCVHAAVTEEPHVCKYRDKCLQLQASSGRYTHTDGLAHRRVPFGAYKIGRLASAQEHKFLTNDVVHDQRVHNHDWARELGLVSFVGYQLRPTSGEALGVLALFSKHAITQEEDAQLDALSSTTAQVLHAAEGVERLKESEKRFKTMFNEAPLGIALIDSLTGRIYEVNLKFAKIAGRTMEQMTNIDWMSITHPDDVQEDIDNMALFNTGKIPGFQMQKRYLHLDGTAVWINMTIAPLKAEDKYRHHHLCMIEDITERKLAEEFLKASTERFRSLIEASPIGMSIFRQGKPQYVNPAMMHMFGHESEAEILGSGVEDLYEPGSGDLIKKLMTTSLEGMPVPYHQEARGLKKSGKAFDISMWMVKIEFEGDPAILTFMLDVSEEKSLRSQLFQAQKMEAVGTLAGGVAHDFNNLLTVVMGFSELLLIDKDEQDPAYADLQKIHKAGQKGADLVRRLLSFSRKSEIKPRPLNLNHQIEQLEKMLTRTIPKMIKIELSLADGLFPVNADPTQMDQVLMNLAMNAKDAIPDGGKLTIETANVFLDEEYARTYLGAKPGGYVLLSVSDTGHGMNKETLDHIFEPFYTTKEVGKGTGLGLAMVYGIVHQHGGQVRCYSEPGRGTSFKIYLPALVAEREELETATREALPRGGTETILLVDDEEFVQDLGKRILERSGYTVLTAANGKEALDLYKEERARISLVILDLIMPEMGGKQCLGELLKIDPKARVLIASGFAANGQTKEAIKTGARGFVDKPYNMKGMLQSVREVLDEE
ncbi:MAG: PAS domain S-box protein [Pseudomonadota bacterium]